MNNARLWVMVLSVALTACSVPLRDETDYGASDAWMCMDPLHREVARHDQPSAASTTRNALTRLWVATQEMAIATLAQISRMSHLGNPTSSVSYPLRAEQAPIETRFSLRPEPDALEVANMVVLNNGGWQLNVGQEMPTPLWPQCDRWLTWSGLN
jgi:hypothetical protein